MATKEQISSLLKKLNMTAEKIQELWDNAKLYSQTVRNLSSAGKNWSDLNIPCIESLVTLKEEHLKHLEDAKKEEQAKMAEVEKENKRKESLRNEEELLKRIYSKDLNEDELRKIVFECSIAEIIETTYGEKRRWSRSACTIIRIKDLFFAINWEDGLTESQENIFSDQPYQVNKIEKTITKKIIEWEKV